MLDRLAIELLVLVARHLQPLLAIRLMRLGKSLRQAVLMARRELEQVTLGAA